MVTVASVQPHAGPGGRIIDALLRGQHRLQDNPCQEGCFTPSVLFPLRPLAVISFRLPTDVSSSLSLILSLEIYLPRVSSLSISTVVDVSVETEDPTTPPANHAAATPRSSEKQSESRLRRNHHASCRRRSFSLVPARGEIFRFGLFHTVHFKFQKSTLEA